MGRGRVLLLLLVAACGGSRQPDDGAMPDTGVDAPAAPDGGDADVPGDSGSTCPGSPVRVEAEVVPGMSQAAYAPSGLRLIVGPDRGEPLAVHEMTPGAPERLPAAAAMVAFPASDPAASLAAAAVLEGDRTALVFQAGSAPATTEVVVLDAAGGVQGRIDLPGLSRMSGPVTEQVASSGDRLAVVAPDGMGAVHVLLLDADATLRVDETLPGRQEPVVTAATSPGSFSLAAVDRLRAFVDLFTLSDAGLVMEGEVPTPGPVPELAVAGDRIATTLRDSLVILAPDGTFEELGLPADALTEGYGALSGIASPLGDVYALQVGSFLWLGLVTPAGIRWEQGTLEGPVGVWLFAGERDVGAYVLSRSDITPHLGYLGLRCPG